MVDGEACGSTSTLRWIGVTRSSMGSRNSKAVVFCIEPCK